MAAEHNSTIPAPEIRCISARFVRIPVTNIERCDLLIERFELGDIAATGPLRLGDKELHDPTGVVKSVTAVLHFRSPVTVDPQHLIVRTPRSTTPASRRTFVEVGLIDTTGALAGSSSGNRVDLRSLQHASGAHALYTVRIPLIRHKLIQPGQMPLIDRIQTKDKFVLHYTIAMAGLVWPSDSTCEYNVRIKVVQTHPDMCEVVSISSSIVDSQRLTEAMHNFKDWVQQGLDALRRKKDTSVEQPAEQHQLLAPQPGDVLAGDHEFYAKLVADQQLQVVPVVDDPARHQPLLYPVPAQSSAYTPAVQYYFPTSPVVAQQ